jgi:phosphotransferase system IIA component
MSRIPMTINDMIGNLGMKRLIEAMDEFKIGNSLMKRVNEVLETKDNKPIIETLSKAEKKKKKKKKKKQKQKVNNQWKKGDIDALKQHKQYMESLGWYNSTNWNPFMPTKPSYSIMHSLREGFSIVIHSGTHRVNLDDQSLRMHKANGVRLHLPPWMCLIWHESLYHSGAKSRDTPRYQFDMRFFSYIWPYIANQARNRTAGTIDGVARETGEQVYREGITYHTCQDIYKEHPTCVHCKRRETVVDLRGIPPTSLVPDERIIGDL